MYSVYLHQGIYRASTQALRYVSQSRRRINIADEAPASISPHGNNSFRWNSHSDRICGLIKNYMHDSGPESVPLSPFPVDCDT